MAGAAPKHPGFGCRGPDRVLFLFMLTLMSGTGVNVGIRLLLLLLLFYLGFLFTYSENKLSVMHLHFLSKLFKPLMCQGNRARLIGLPRN